MAARAEASGDGPKNTGALRIAGVVVLALVAVGIGAVRMGWIPFGASQEQESVLARTAEPVAGEGEAGAGAPAEAPAPVADAPPPAPAPDGAAGVKEPARRAPARVEATGGSSPTVSAVTKEAPRVTRVAHVDEHVTYQYNAIGRRDPFQSLISGEFLGHNEGGDAPPDPGGMKVVGIVWGATDQFAMVEDARGNSHVLRKGDKLQNGVVEGLRRDAVVIVVTADGQSQQVVIPFVRKGEGNAP
jgi:hypothetical protein